MEIKKVKAERIYNSRKEPTILVVLKTDKGSFLASSPGGKSIGSYEADSYKKSLNDDIKIINNLSEKLKGMRVESFDELIGIEKLMKKWIGANSLFALESVFLKVFAAKSEIPLWKFVNLKLNKKAVFPKPIGNCIGGGLHSYGNKKPDFQEFLFIPNTKDFAKAVEINKKTWEEARIILRSIDRKFKRKANDENAWQTSLENEQVLTLMQDIRDNIFEETGVFSNMGVDIAASTFFKKNGYIYKNPMSGLNARTQINYISKIIKDYKIFYAEDPLNEEDFQGFSELRKIVNSKCLVAGDDLTATNMERLKKAIKLKSINAMIVKPNQNGSLLDVKKIIDLCKKNDIKTIISHRSGETLDTAIADFAFAWQCDYIKAGITGKEREVKLNRLIEIEKSV